MEPPDKRIILFWLLLLIILLAVGFLIFKPKAPQKPYVSLESCFYEQPNIVYVPTTYVLGTLVDEELYRIIKCESNFQPEVCSYAGCESGMGLCQLIPGTVRYCEEKLGRPIDPFNPEDNLACGIWLYENEGNSHWDMSRDCWGK